MSAETKTLHRVARPTTPTLVVVATVAVAFFASGFYTSRLLDEGRVREQSQARFQEFLSIGTDLGFVTIDQQKLDELECITAEAEWADEGTNAEPDQAPPTGKDAPLTPCERTGRE